jgi:hypothetical protein
MEGWIEKLLENGQEGYMKGCRAREYKVKKKKGWSYPLWLFRSVLTVLFCQSCHIMALYPGFTFQAILSVTLVLLFYVVVLF